MSAFQFALLAGAAITLIRAWEVPRAVLWVALGALSFIFSTAWGRYGFPYPSIFGALTDVMVWLVIYHLAEKRWELSFAACFQMMILVNIIFQAGNLTGWWDMTNWARVVFLELLNWTALSVVWLTAATEKASHHAGHHTAGPLARGIGLVGRALHRQRPSPPWTKIP